jgi:hypothetical protein
MKSESNKYWRIVDILKRSEPLLSGNEALEEKVMERIMDKRNAIEGYSFFESLFGWVYIGWVRNGLIAASIFIIAFFAVQQSIILKRIDNLERKEIITSPSFVNGVTEDLEPACIINTRSGKISLKGNKLSDRQVKQLQEAIYDLQSRYSNLIKLIEDNPELKQYVENKLSESDKKKFNL